MDVENLRSKLEQLNPDERKLLKAKLLGYTRGLPPTIDQFIDDPYFMGSSWSKMLYPYWRQVLREIYPDEITTSHNIIVESLALGTGKTTVAIVMGAYNLCRLLYLEDLSRTGVNDMNKPIVLLYMHTSTDKAYQECIDPLWAALQASPFFKQKKYPFPKKFEIVGDSLRSNNAVGTNLIFASFSEVNFVNASKMKQRMNTIINRYTNRFMAYQGFLGNIILDSSPSGTDSLVESFLKKTPFAVKIIRAAVWEVKGFLGTYSTKTFKVYAGDASHKPFIIEGENKLPVAYDPDRVIEVPMNLYKNYKTDIILALQDTAGLSVSNSGSWIKNLKKIEECLHLPQNYPSYITVDQFDPEDNIIDYFINNIKEILPVDRRIFLHIDLGITGDAAGISAGYYAGEYIDDDRDLSIIKPKITIPLSFRLYRKKGQETSINKIIQFVIWLTTIYEMYVSMDTFQSRVIKQTLEENHVKTCFVSVDRSVDPYNFVKLEMYENLIEGPKDKNLNDEFAKLKLVGGKKVDHPKDFHKDEADSFTGCAWNIRQNLKWAAKLPKFYQMLMAQEALNKIYGNGNVVTQLNKKIENLMNSEDDGWDD